LDKSTNWGTKALEFSAAPFPSPVATWQNAAIQIGRSDFEFYYGGKKTKSEGQGVGQEAVIEKEDDRDAAINRRDWL
jgi:hypothetical protein